MNMVTGKKHLLLTAALLLVMSLCLSPAAAQTLSGQDAAGYNALVLTPGHSQTILFELGSTVMDEQYDSCLLLTAGAGRLTIRVGPASSVGEFDGLVYAVAGFVGFQPVLEWAYNAETISISVDVPEVAAGVLFTGILTAIGDPDFPVVMSMVVSHAG